jgi:hypothetical protein
MSTDFDCEEVNQRAILVCTPCTLSHLVRRNEAPDPSAWLAWAASYHESRPHLCTAIWTSVAGCWIIAAAPQGVEEGWKFELETHTTVAESARCAFRVCIGIASRALRSGRSPECWPVGLSGSRQSRKR